MIQLHPHWHSTGDGDQDPLPLSKKPASAVPTRIPVGLQGVSRRPAAALGILTVLVAGFSFFDVIPSIRGTEVAQSIVATGVQIRITENGLVPKAANVRPGQEIVWINEDTIPHILESDTLMGSNGTTLYTPAIFPGSEQRFTLSQSQATGRHSYISTTSVDVFGEINVLATDGSTVKGAAPVKPSKKAVDDKSIFGDLEAGSSSGTEPAIAAKQTAQSSSSAKNTAVIAPDNREDTIDSMDPLGPLTAGVAPTSSQSDPVGKQNSLIPYNPYTVGSTREHPFDTSGEPVSDTAHAGAPLKNVKGYKPFTQPKTGPGLWVAVALSLAAVTFVTRPSKRLSRAGRRSS